jgi:S1-C subfamily serine protease
MIPCHAAWLLLLLATTASAAAEPGSLGVRMKDSERAVVSQVLPGGAAAVAGVAAGDVLLAVDGVETPTCRAFVEVMRACSAGERLMIRFRRDERESYALVELASPARRGRGEAAGVGYLGVRARAAGAGLAVIEVVPGGPMSRAGVAPGDVLCRLDSCRLGAIADLDAALATLGVGRVVLVELRRGGRRVQSRVTLGAQPTASSRARAVTAEVCVQARALRAELQTLQGLLAELRGRRE